MKNLFSQLADVFFAELPRIRLDGRANDRPRSRKAIWEPSPQTIHEEAEDEMVFNSSNMELNTALQNCLGEFSHVMIKEFFCSFFVCVLRKLHVNNLCYFIIEKLELE